MTPHEIHSKLTTVLDTPPSQSCDELSDNWSVVRDCYDCLRRDKPGKAEGDVGLEISA